MEFSSKVPAVSGIFLFTLFVNLYFGYLRGRQKKFSFQWFLYIHLPIPFVVFARLFFNLDYGYIPVFILAAVAGQVFGSRLG